jgi:hypothetical protein
MTKTIQAVLAAKAAKKAEEEAVAARVEKTVQDAIERTDAAVTELCNLEYRITKMPTIGNTIAESARIKADGYRLWFMWIGKRLGALVDHGELLGPYNNRPITKIGEQSQAHIPYDEVQEWADEIFTKTRTFTPTNGEGAPICDVLDDGWFRMCIPGRSDTAKVNADQAMQKAAEWLAEIIDPESFVWQQ